MTVLAELRSEGWHLSNEGFDLCSENDDKPSLSSVIRKALDMDLREIGGNFLPEDLTRGKAESLSGPGVLQIQKIKNASAPKYEYGSGAPPILRLLLTDGNNYINCLQWGNWKSISIETPPGTKIFLKPGKIPMQSSFLLLSEHQFTVLGGCVAAMVEKWDLNRKLASHIRTKENLDGTGPPPWTPFGQQILVKPSRSGNFRALEAEAKEAKEDAVFKQQRQANIAEVARVKETKSKSFGGRKEKPLVTKQDNVNTSYNQSTTYASNDYDSRRVSESRVSESSQNSPMKSRQPTNDRNRRGGKNDYAQSRQDTRFQPSNNSSGPQSNMKDNKFENRTTKLGDFITHDLRQRSTFQAKPANFEPSGANVPKQHKTSVRDPGEKQSQNSRNVTGEVVIFGYDGKGDRKNFAVSGLKQGMEVMARYWEDNQFYRAVVHAVGQQGTTCVVHFLDYGNFEEVLISDVHALEKPQERKDRNWNAGPISFQPTPRSNYDNYPGYENQNHKDNSNHYDSSNKGYGRRDTQRDYRQKSGTEYRASNRLYHPPNHKDFNS